LNPLELDTLNQSLQEHLRAYPHRWIQFWTGNDKPTIIDWVFNNKTNSGWAVYNLSSDQSPATLYQGFFEKTETGVSWPLYCQSLIDTVVEMFNDTQEYTTTKKGVLKWNGKIPDKSWTFSEELSFNRSTNCLSKISIGKHSLIIKEFKLMDRENGEVEFLTTLKNAGFTSGTKLHSSLIYKSYLQGETLDTFLRNQVRLSPRNLNRAANDSKFLMQLAGETLEKLHSLKFKTSDSDLFLNNIIYADDIIKECQTYISKVDSALGVDLINLIDFNSFKSLPGIQSGVFHGDLHLSHFLIENSKCYLLDISPPSKRSEVSTGHPFRDLVRFRRALEYFWMDEALTALSQELNISEEDVLKYFRPEISDHLQADILSVFSRVCCEFRTWSDILYNDFKKTLGVTSMENKFSGWWDLFYLRELLREADYNISYGRTIFLEFDRYFLQNFQNENIKK